LRAVADKYEVLEKMASEPGSELVPVLVVAGRIATAGLSQAGELIAAMFPESNEK